MAPSFGSSELSRPQQELRLLVESWKKGRGLGRHLTAVEHIAARQARYGAFPPPMAPELVAMLRARGFESLYTHQAQAVTNALAGRHTVVVTPTASGKSLCYNLPVMQALVQGANALYLFPTKALSQDQCAELNKLLGLMPEAPPDWEAQVYDGDTPPDVRRRIRQNSRLIITNPDMLHAAILPHHARWASFFANLRYIVIDELHTYRGLFGSHVANVIARLRRVAAHYGCQPTFIATSATIANPRELAQTLVGDAFELVDDNGAPASEKYICFLNPPIVDMQNMRRQSALSAAQRVAEQALRRKLGTIVFARSRQSVEVFIHRLREKLQKVRQEPGLSDLAQRVASYRGGYLPELRRSIERGLRSGQLLGVVSTNALELGIDIGSLDVCVLAGYPGTIASTWQQMGRAGRSGGVSLAMLIASDSPMDQFIIHHPEYFLGQSPEAARIDPTNLRVAAEHLKCACFELSWSDGESLGSLPAEHATEILEFLSAEQGMLQRDGARWRWADRTYPANSVNLRGLMEENFVVVDESGPEPVVLAEVDFDSAHLTLYPNAVYQVSGRPYRVERLDYTQRRAYVRPSSDGYYTTAMHYEAVHVLDVFQQRTVRRANIGFGEVRVTKRFVGFKKIRFGTGENVGYGELNLPELDLHTMAYWLELSDREFPELAKRPDAWARMVHGAGQVLRTAASIMLMCDPGDLDLCIGSVSEDQWLAQGMEGLVVRDGQGQAQWVSGGGAGAAEPTGLVGPVLHTPQIFVYDRHPGGVGFGEGLFADHEDLMGMALSLARQCPCQAGCPSCVGPPESPGVETKTHVITVLSQLGQKSSGGASDRPRRV